MSDKLSQESQWLFQPEAKMLVSYNEAQSHWYLDPNCSPSTKLGMNKIQYLKWLKWVNHQCIRDSSTSSGLTPCAGEAWEALCGEGMKIGLPWPSWSSKSSNLSDVISQSSAKNMGMTQFGHDWSRVLSWFLYLVSSCLTEMPQPVWSLNQHWHWKRLRNSCETLVS